MLTNKDIEKLVKVFATKDDVRRIVREEIQPLETRLERALTALDRPAKATEDQTREWAAMSTQLSRHEKGIKLIVRKAGVVLNDD